MLKNQIVTNPQKRFRPRVLLADDHPVILEVLTCLLEPWAEVVGKASNGWQALEMARQLLPDLLLLDISMPKLDGLAVARQLQSSTRAIKILVFSCHSEASWVRSAFDAGASGYLCKTCFLGEIEAAVSAVLAGQVWISPALMQDLAPDIDLHGSRPWACPSACALTARESEVLELLASSLNNNKIALHLGVSVTTVRTHLSSIYKKLNVDSRVRLALYASHVRWTSTRFPKNMWKLGTFEENGPCPPESES